MPKLPVVKPRELLAVLKRMGFSEFHHVGSHAQFKHADGRRITVPVHFGRDINKKTLRGIINDLEISVEEFVKALKG